MSIVQFVHSTTAQVPLETKTNLTCGTNFPVGPESDKRHSITFFPTQYCADQNTLMGSITEDYSYICK